MGLEGEERSVAVAVGVAIKRAELGRDGLGLAGLAMNALPCALWRYKVDLPYARAYHRVLATVSAAKL